MVRKSRATIMAEYDSQCAAIIAQVSDKMAWVTPDSVRTVETAFGSATLIAMRWQPASIGGTWGTYRMTSGDTRGFCVSATEVDTMCKACNIEYPKYPR